MNFRDLRDLTLAEIRDIALPNDRTQPMWQFGQRLRTVHNQYFAKASQEKLAPGAHMALHQEFTQGIATAIKETDLGNIFISIHYYKEGLLRSAKKAALVADQAQHLIGHLDGFRERLTLLIQDPKNISLAIDIMYRYERIEKALVYFTNCQEVLTKMGELLGESQKPPKQYGALDLGFGYETSSVAELVSRVSGLQSIYHECCLLLEVNETEYPLLVSKIESGSLRTRLFGESKVVEFIIWFFKASIHYLYRNFTTEGKLASIPTDVRVLEQQFGLLSRLREELPEERYRQMIEQQAESLAKSAAVLAKHTQNLLERETRLKIDDEVIELDSSLKQKYLKPPAKQLPEHSSSDTGDQNESGQPGNGADGG